MGFIAVVCGLPAYVFAVFIGAAIGGQTGIVIALLLAAPLCYCIGWVVAQNRREEVAARDAQIKLGRHLTRQEETRTAFRPTFENRELT